MVFGTTFGDNDERVCAAVVPTPAESLSKDDIIRIVHDERGAAFAPEIVLVLDELPTTSSQKPDRNALRRVVESQH